MLSTGDIQGLPDNSAHMGSIEQLRFGKLVGDALGIDPVFGALLSPTGGIPGAGNQRISDFEMALFGGPEIVVPHGIAHDAAGYLMNYHGIGPGYHYVPDATNPMLSTRNSLGGQFEGLDLYRNLKLYNSPYRPLTTDPYLQ